MSAVHTLPTIEKPTDAWFKLGKSFDTMGHMYGGVIDGQNYRIHTGGNVLQIEGDALDDSDHPLGLNVRFNASGFVIDDMPPTLPLSVVGGVLLAAQLFLTWRGAFD